MNYIIWIVCLFWIICGIISYGFDFAYFQKKYPSDSKHQYKIDQIACFSFAFFGPFNLIDIYVNKRFVYSMKYKK